jgi:hypothetical protein
MVGEFSMLRRALVLVVSFSGVLLLESGAEVRTIRGHTARANSVALTGDGLLI